MLIYINHWLITGGASKPAGGGWAKCLQKFGIAASRRRKSGLFARLRCRNDRLAPASAVFVLFFVLGVGRFPAARAVFAAFFEFFDPLLFPALLRGLAFMLALFYQFAALLLLFEPALLQLALFFLVQSALWCRRVLMRRRAVTALQHAALMTFFKVAVKLLAMMLGLPVKLGVLPVKSRRTGEQPRRESSMMMNECMLPAPD